MRRVLIAFLILLPIAAAQEPAAATKEAAAADAVARIAEIEVELAETEDPYPAMPLGPERRNYYGFLQFLRGAAKDGELDAVVLKLKGYGVGLPRLLEVREALQGLRQAGKKVFVFKESLSMGDLLLASVADRISVPESGTVLLPGLAMESWYMRAMLEKIRVRFDVIHIGEYKTAGESLVRDSMSKELKESLDPILDELYNSIVGTIAEGRGLSVEAVRAAIDQGILTPREAQAAGLIDRVEYHDQFRDGIRAFFPDRKLKLAGDYKRDSGPKIDPNNPMAALSLFFSLLSPPKEKKLPGPKVAIVYCTGTIVSGKSQYGWTGDISAMGSDTIVAAIDKAREDEEVRAIVLRINSPGGSGLASDMIWRAVERAKAVKPVVASMGDVAASGGYFIAMNANAIVAEPQTITGSIGVVGIVPNVDGLFGWVGITPERMTRGKRAAAFGTSKGLEEEDKAVLRSYMRTFYGDFVAKVAAGRGKTPAEIEPLARGRIWTGRDALRHGLVDRLGGLEDAILVARERGGIAADAVRGEDYHVIEMPRRAGPFEALQEMFEVRLGLDEALVRELPVLRRVLRHLSALRLAAGDRICVIAPELAGLATPFAGTAR